NGEKALEYHQEATTSFVKAAINLQRYLGLVRDDTEARAEYAKLLDELAETSDQFLVVLDQFERVLHRDPDRQDVRQRAVVRAMQVGRRTDALDHLDYLIEKLGIKNNAELYDWRGQCEEALGKHEEAVTSFENALKLEPDRIACYVRKALVQRLSLQAE